MWQQNHHQDGCQCSQCYGCYEPLQSPPAPGWNLYSGWNVPSQSAPPPTGNQYTDWNVPPQPVAASGGNQSGVWTTALPSAPPSERNMTQDPCYSQNQNVPPPYEAEANLETGQAAPKPDFSFSSNSIRAAFIRKVFALVFIMLTIVAVLTAIPYMSTAVRDYVQNSLGMYVASYVIFVAVYLVLMCCQKIQRTFPINLIAAFILTLAIGYLTMCICAWYDVVSVLLCFIMTAVCTAGITIFSMQTKYDLTSKIGIVSLLGLALFVFGIVAVISATVFNVQWLYTVYAGLAAILFMAYLAIDVQMIMGGKKYEISPEDYIYAAVTLFIDIVYIFWMLLAVFGKK